MSEHYDLVVIGSGPAGEKGAAQAAYFGKRVCIVERAPKPGGAAINTGGVPSKTLRETALYFSGLRQRGLYGVDYHVKRDITIADFMFRERSVIEAEWKLIDENLRKHGIAKVQGTARFLNPNEITVTRYAEAPRHITGDYFLIATGSQPQHPDGIDVDGTLIVDSDSLLTLERIPASMIVIGGGIVGCEYAGTFAALGVRVTLITSRSRLLTQLDTELSDALRAQMTARLGVQVYTDIDVTRITADNGRAQVVLGGETELTADCILYCVARNGAIAGLGLDEIGVRTNARGFVLVDGSYRTAIPEIYAAGDVIGQPALASTAMEQARVAVCHAFDFRYKQQIATILPFGVWTIPEVAMVGETPEQLTARGVEFEVGRSSFRINPRGQVIGDLDGFVKLVFRADTQQLLGVSVIGEGACELIHIGMACMAFGGTIDFFIQSVFMYPSLADVFKYAAYDGLQAIARRHAKRQSLPPTGGYRAVGA
ncbi:MAG TPA: Si-specific NAD(P)(+) transhydrogenase [Gemmatimonadaceae bacterium]|nr:Si-specific NAD(P)(+) transhydrogenase [Gemmatimonadaceae bacterium]